MYKAYEISCTYAVLTIRVNLAAIIRHSKTSNPSNTIDSILISVDFFFFQSKPKPDNTNPSLTTNKQTNKAWLFCSHSQLGSDSLFVLLPLWCRQGLVVSVTVHRKRMRHLHLSMMIETYRSGRGVGPVVRCSKSKNKNHNSKRRYSNPRWS